MAILSGTLSAPFKLFEPYSLTPGGRVFNLKIGLLYQQSGQSGNTTEYGDPFSVPMGSVLTPVTLPAASLFKGMKFGSAMSPNVTLTLPTSVTKHLSLTEREVTVSMWVSGSTYASTTQGLKTSYKLRVSGTNGIQMVVGSIDSVSAGSAASYAVATMSDLTGAPVNVVASTRKTVGLNANQLASSTPSSFDGRWTETLIDAGLPNPINLNSSDWHHIVYVQRAAEKPVRLTYSEVLGTNTSPLQFTSSTGQEGLCQLWLDGDLVYESPAFGPFPQGYAPYFVEQGIQSLSNPSSTVTVYPTAKTQVRTLRQNGAVATLSGSFNNGDAIAQLAIWKRCLNPDEIKSIYSGIKNGVYLLERSSTSSKPKRLIDLNSSVGEKYLSNQGFQDSVGGQTLQPFTEGQPNSQLDNLTYQQNHYYDAMSPLLASTIIEDGTTAKPQKNVATYRDSHDSTSYVSDPEFVIPSGSALIKIPIENVDRHTRAGRYYTGYPGLVDLYIDYVGAPSVSNLIGTGFLYYSPKLKRWVEKRADAASSQTNDSALLVKPQTQASASNFISQRARAYDDILRTENPILGNEVMCQFSWSPQFGYYVNHVEHLRQAGYERIGWPTSFFGAPNAPRYHAYDHETIKLSDYINRPFILKKIEMRVPVKSTRRFGANPNEYGASPPYSPSANQWENQITNKKDMDNYVFFVYRQRRVSRNRDSSEDRNTSKRYLIASASVCYVNSASFGGGWKDGFFNPRAIRGWPDTGARAVYSSSLARPGDVTDYYGVSLTQISGTNCVLHNPNVTIEWGEGRFVGSPGDATSTDRQVTTTLQLEMLPLVVPVASVSPSLMPLTTSAPGLPTSFSLREGGNSSDYNNNHIITGTRANPNAGQFAPSLTLVSHVWNGGRRPPLLGYNTPTVDPYDTTTPSLSSTGFMLGMLDSTVSVLPVFSAAAFVTSSTTVESTTKWVSSRGPVQGHGVTNFPFNFGLDSLSPSKFTAQIPLDPQSVNVQSTYGRLEQKFFGRKPALNGGDANNWTEVDNEAYMGRFGWRFISSFSLSNFSESQIYSPEILEPEDELIIGLDAGTFGPPDLDVDDVLVPGSVGLAEGDTGANALRLFKNTYLKEDYRYTLADSRLQILPGEAEIVLIGDFLEDQSPVSLSRDTPGGVGISIVIGDDLITDKNFLYTADLLSGSIYTRIFTGSQGPAGLIEGNSDAAKARRFYFDQGTRRSQ